MTNILKRVSIPLAAAFVLIFFISHMFSPAGQQMSQQAASGISNAIDNSRPLASSAADQGWNYVIAEGYAGGNVTFGRHRFDCGDGNIKFTFMFNDWSTDSVSLPGECPKDNKGLIDSLEKLYKEAKSLKKSWTGRLWDEIQTFERLLPH